VLVVGGVSMSFLGRQWQIVAEAVGAFRTLVAEGIGGVVSGYVAEAGEVGWCCCFGGAAVRMEAPASFPSGEGSRWCTRAPQVLLFLY
jgi:hypothetical protein